MTALASVLASLSSLLLGAHFLRRGGLLLVLACLALVALAWVRRRWAGWTVVIGLGIGALEWLRTLIATVSARAQSGAPYGRLVLILGAVTVLTALSAWLHYVRGVGPARLSARNTNRA